MFSSLHCVLNLWILVIHLCSHPGLLSAVLAQAGKDGLEGSNTVTTDGPWFGKENESRKKVKRLNYFS